MKAQAHPDKRQTPVTLPFPSGAAPAAVRTIQKNDLAGGRLPSKRFGVNAAWWAIMVLAFNLNSAMKRLVLAPALGKSWASRRLKAIRFLIIALPGRVVDHARELWVRIGGDAALSRLRRIRARIAAIA
jgi:hypothetical protein